MTQTVIGKETALKFVLRNGDESRNEQSGKVKR